MKVLLSLLLLLAAGLPAEAADRPECKRYRPRPAPEGGLAPQKSAADGYHYIGACKRNGNWKRIEGSKPMKRLLQGSARMFGQNLEVYSCFRSQESQDLILCNFGCAPRFGNEQCSGRIATNKSEHTYGTAADFFVQTSVPAGASHAVRSVEIAKLCQQAAQARTQFQGGRGGVTIYGIDPENSKASLHFDTKPDWCNWGACEKVLGEGHCKRKKYEEKEARLMAAVAAAKTLQRRQEVARLERELARLRADCKPGDLSCRDVFKD